MLWPLLYGFPPPLSFLIAPLLSLSLRLLAWPVLLAAFEEPLVAFGLQRDAPEVSSSYRWWQTEPWGAVSLREPVGLALASALEVLVLLSSSLRPTPMSV